MRKRESAKNSFKYTYENTFDGVSKILLGKGDGASGENRRTGHPIVKSKNGSINVDWVQVGKASNLVPQVEPPIVHHDMAAILINFSSYNQDIASNLATVSAL